jgi:serine protease Do
VAESVKTTGKISRPYLGVRYILVNDELKEKNQLPVDYGALVLRGDTPSDLAVIPSSPADKAGIEENDIILELDGQTIDADRDLAATIATKQVGDTLELKVLHDGEERLATVVLEEKL